MPFHFSRLLMMLLACLASAAAAAPATLGNGSAAWSFDATGLASVGKTRCTSSWQLTLKDNNGVIRTLTPGNAMPEMAITEGTAVTLTWKGIQDSATGTRLDVIQTASFRADSGATAWTTRVSGTSAATLWSVSSPIFTLSAPAALALPERGGRLVTAASAPFSTRLSYPGEASMQFLAAWTAEAGLAVFAEDPSFSAKTLTASVSTDAAVMALAALPEIPAGQWPASTEPKSVSYQSPYPTVAIPCTKDWKTAAETYRQRVASSMTASNASTLPADTVWFDSQYEPQTALATWASASQALKKPVITPYRSYTAAKHGVFSPDLLPLDPYFRSAMQVARRFNVTPAPCLSPCLWDTRSQTWLQAPATQDQVADPAGTPVTIHDIKNGHDFAVLCPATARWQKTLRETIALLRHNGARAICLEHLLPANCRCCNGSHGHSLHGGSTIAASLARALDALRAENCKSAPEFLLLTSCPAECLIGHVDGFAIASTADSIPLFETVYQGLAPIIASAALPEKLTAGGTNGDLRLLIGNPDTQQFPFLTAETATELWGCDDAAVIRNPKKKHGMLKPSYENAEFSIRKSSLYILPPPKEADGSALPCRWEKQPFACMYKLPYTMESKHLVTVLAGSGTYLTLNCHTNKTARFNTDRTGVFAARIIADKASTPDGTFRFFSSPAELNAAIQAPETTEIVSIGYAAFNDATLKNAETMATAFGLPTVNLSAAWNAMKTAPSLDALSRLNHELRNVMLNANNCPQLFAAGAPGEQLFREIQALVMAAALTPSSMNQPMLAFHSDGLQPGTPQSVVTAFVSKKPEELLSRTTLTAMGIQPPAVFTATPITDKDDEHFPGFTVTLDVPPATLQTVTITACMPFTVQGVELLAMDLGWMTVVPSLALHIPSRSTLVMPGKAARSAFSIQNLSSRDNETAEFETETEIPKDWTVLVEPKISKAEWRTQANVALSIQVPETLPEGPAALTVTATRLNSPAQRQKTVVSLDSIHAPTPAAASPVATLAADKPQSLVFRQSGLLAFYPKKGESYSFRIQNNSAAAIRWTLYNPNLEAVRGTKLDASDSIKINGSALRDAPYFLAVRTPANGASVIVTASTHATSLRASAATPASISENSSEYYFHADGDFTLRTADASATASIVLTSPSGRIMLCEPNETIRVKPIDTEKGKTWKITLNGAQGASLSLAGQTAPWLAHTPESILK